MKGLGLSWTIRSGSCSNHDVVQGSASSVSQYVGAYTPKFVHAVLETVPKFRCQPVLCVQEDCMPPHRWEQVLAVAEAKPSKEGLIPVIKKLHQNLAPLIMIWCVCSAMVRLPQKQSMWLDTMNATFVKAW